ncbi:MAG: TonB-dependent receptor plug domain-containing protein, partial [Deltaproteobacteria bacterium]
VSESASQTLQVNPQFHRSLIQVFQKSPSVWAQESGVQSSPHVVLRGQDLQQSRYFLEGIPLTDSQFNADVVSLLPFQTVARMDIFPDSIPVGLASDGLGGGVDFHLWEQIQPVVGVKTGSFGFGELFTKTSLGHPKRHITFNLIRSDENFKYYDDGGTPLNSALGEIRERTHNKFLRMGVTPLIPIVTSKTSDWKYFGLNSFRNLQIPGPVSLPMNGELTQMFHLSAISGESWLAADLKSKSLVYAKIDSQKYRTDQKTKSLSSMSSNDSLNQTFGLRNYFQFYQFYPLRIEQALGVNYERYDFKSLAELSSATPSPELNQRWDLPVALAGYVPIKDWEIKPAIMAQFFWYQGKTENHYLMLSPRLGISLDRVFGVKQLRLESSLGKFYRAPSMMELNGNPFGVSPSRELQPEKADKVSMGIGWEKSFLEGWISGVKMSYAYSLAVSKNLIAYIQNSQNSQIATNIGESLIQSHEAQVELEMVKKLFSHTSISLLQT